MLKRVSIVTLLALLTGVFATQASAAPPTDFWANKHFMNMAHTGGADEAPANTLFAFKTSADRGADAIEMDGYLTADGHFVITHDMEPHKTSDAPYSNYNSNTNPPTLTNPEYFITNQTLADLKQYDFAYKFRMGTGHHGYPHGDAPESDYIYRGIATGAKAPPEGFTANDFKIATFEEVLDAMPNMPMTVDMKAPRGDISIATAAATEVARIMNARPERSEDVMIVSFFQDAIEKFHELAPNHKALGATEDELLPYALTDDPISPTPVALQPPDNYTFGDTVIQTTEFLKEKATRDGYAIQVWPQNGSVDGPELWQKLLDQGADGFFTDKVADMHEFLCEKGVRRPDGSARCPQQECPAGTVGTPPNCDVIVDPKTVLTRVAIAPKKRAIRAGKTIRMRVTVRAKVGIGPKRFRVNLRSSNRQVRLPKSVVVRLKGNTGRALIKVRATRKARGKARITVRHRKLTARAALNVKKIAKKKKRRKARR